MSKRVLDLNFETDYYHPPSPNIEEPTWQETIINSCTYELQTTNEITTAMEKFIKNGIDEEDISYRQTMVGDRFLILQERKQMLLLTLLDTAKVLL